MKTKDYSDFVDLWQATHESMAGGKKLSGLALEMIFEAFEDYEFEVIEKAIKHHMKTVQFAPTVYDIIELISKTQTQHVGVEEAWSIAQQLFDEKATVCVTDEILTAYEVSRPLYPDKTAMRMAFKEKYSALMINPKPVVWNINLGWDKSGRVETINDAVKIGRLSHDEAKQLCIGYEKTCVDSDELAKHNLKIIGDMLKKISEEKTPNQLKTERAEKLKADALDAIARLREQQL